MITAGPLSFGILEELQVNLVKMKDRCSPLTMGGGAPPHRGLCSQVMGKGVFPSVANCEHQLFAEFNVFQKQQ